VQVGPGQRHAGKGELPAHEHHEREAEEHEDEPGDQVLDADDLVVRGEDVAADEAELVMLVRMVVVRIVRGAVGRGSVSGFYTGR
jgi:hypothetical protein